MHKKCSIINVIARLCSKHGFEPSAGSVAFSLSVSECLSWLPMAIAGDLNPPQWIPPSPIFSFIAGIKERRDSQRLWALLSYQILLMTLGKRHSLLYLHDSEIQSSVKCRVFQWKIFKFLSGSCVRSGIAHVYSVLLPAHKFIESSLWTQGKAQQCIKTKHFSSLPPPPPARSSASAAGLGSGRFLMSQEELTRSTSEKNVI